MKNKEKFKQTYEKTLKDMLFYELQSKKLSEKLATFFDDQKKTLIEFTDTATDLSDEAFESYLKHQTHVCVAFVLNALFLVDDLTKEDKLEIKIEINSKCLFKREFNFSFSDNWLEKDVRKFKKILKQLGASNFFSTSNIPQVKLVSISKKTTLKYLFSLFSPDKMSRLEPFFIDLKITEMKKPVNTITDEVSKASIAKKYKI